MKIYIMSIETISIEASICMETSALRSMALHKRATSGPPGMGAFDAKPVECTNSINRIHSDKNAFAFAIFRPNHGIFWCESLMAGPGRGARAQSQRQGGARRVNLYRQVLTRVCQISLADPVAGRAFRAPDADKVRYKPAGWGRKCTRTRSCCIKSRSRSTLKI